MKKKRPQGSRPRVTPSKIKKNFEKAMERQEDIRLSETMKSRSSEPTLKRFYEHFPDKEACMKRLIDFTIRSEVSTTNKDGKIGKTIIFYDSRCTKSTCDCMEATILIRKRTVSPPEDSDSFSEYDYIEREQYQCKECYSQFGLTTGWVFWNTRIDLWIWFLSVYVMICMNGKKPKKWLAEKYLAHLQEIGYEDRPSENDELVKLQKKIFARVKRVTDEISNVLFNKGINREDYIRYMSLLGIRKIYNHQTFSSWYRANEAYRSNWKISLRKRDYPKDNKELVEIASINGVEIVYRVQYVGGVKSCKRGDWILCVRALNGNTEKIGLKWMYVDQMLPIHSNRSSHAFQAVQLGKMPICHEIPFVLDKKFIVAFKAALIRSDFLNSPDFLADDVFNCPQCIIDHVVKVLIPSSMRHEG